MKKILLASIAFLLFTILYGQATFEKTYGGTGNEYGSTITTLFDGGYLFGSNYDRQPKLVKLDSLGDTLWTRIYPFVGNLGEITSVIQTSDSNFIVTGFAVNVPPFSFQFESFILKIDTRGDTIWSKKIVSKDITFYNKIVEDNKNRLVVVGFANDTSAYNYIIMRRMDSNGILDTTFKPNIPCLSQFAGCQLSEIYIDNKGNYLVSGYATTGLLPNPRLVKVDTSGKIVWDKYYLQNSGTVEGITQTADGSYLLVILDSVGADSTPVYKIANNGSFQWKKSFKGRWEYLSIDTADGGYLIAGSDKDIHLMRLDSSFNFEWSEVFGGVSDEISSQMKITEDGGTLIIGSTESFGAGGYDVYVVKTNSKGLLTKLKSINLSSVAWNVYPNPTSGQLTIPEIDQLDKILIYNVQGQLVQEIIPVSQGEIQIKMKGREGVYLLQLYMKDGSSYSSKIVKEFNR